jgi:hypothetical protein
MTTDSKPAAPMSCKNDDRIRALKKVIAATQNKLDIAASATSAFTNVTFISINLSHKDDHLRLIA